MHQVLLAPGSTLNAETAAQIEAMTIAYGNAFIAFDAAKAIALMSQDVIYESQSVHYPLVGLKDVSDYLTARWAYFEANLSDVFNLALGKVDLPEGKDHPCLIIMRVDDPEGLVALRFDDAGKIKRIDMLHVLPRPTDAVPIANFPIRKN